MIIFKCRLCSDSATSFGYCENHYSKQQKLLSGENLEKETPQEYIRNRIVIDDDGCWIWQLSKTDGYGNFGKDGKGWKAHRYSWVIFHGEIQNNKQLNHKCHKRDCINPDHLYLGDQKENIRDMFAAGRQVILRGEKSGVAKLNEESVRFILNSNLSVKELRVKFGVSDSLIRAVKKRKIWAHVNAE